MGKRSRPRVGARTSHWSTGRRVAFLAAFLAVLLAGAGFAAYVSTGGGQGPAPAAKPSADSPSARPDTSVSASGPATGTVSPPPRLSDPLAYGRAAAVMLWSY
ncbi:hypothetical protein ACFTZM_27830, partial [Streptomyces hydrogenans]